MVIKKILKRLLYVLHYMQYMFFSLNLKKVNILSDKKTIDYILKNNCSLARFGDGEFKWILNQKQNSFQQNSQELSKRLTEVLISEEKNVLIGIPLALKSLENNNFDSKYYWCSIGKKTIKKILPLIKTNRIYANASVTRPYIDYKDKTICKEKFKDLKLLWDKRNVVIVEGEFTKLGVSNDLLDNANSVNRILCPSQNAFNKYNEIVEMVKKVDKKSLILLALGPTATVMAYDLAKLGYQAIDIGHIDIEYEWYKQNATKKVPVVGKQVNEAHDNSYECINIDDENYINSIIGKIDL